MQRECQRLQDLLDDFLNYAKVRHLHLEPTDLNAEIEDAFDFFLPRGDRSGSRDRPLPRSRTAPVMLDREAFRGRCSICCSMPSRRCRRGQLVVRTAATNGRVGLYLIDTGCGMDDRTAAQMFEAFFSTKPGGSGLGLPTTAKIIEAHGGRITVQSEVGRGTQFTIELPIPARLVRRPSGKSESDDGRDLKSPSP